MANREYRTLKYHPRGSKGVVSGWSIVESHPSPDMKRVGDSEKPRFLGKIWQAAKLLETALVELDLDGWELVSTSYSGVIGFYGLAIVRRPATGNPPDSDSGS